MRSAKASHKAENRWSIRKLFTRPWVWGTLPATVAWSADSRKIVFTWNDHGMPFRDLWTFDVASRQLTRLTDMESVKDDMSESEAEQDERLKRYLLPQTGIADFDVSHDGRQIVFVHRGDLFVVSTDGEALRQLTRTKATEDSPLFSPDSRRIAFIRDNDLWILERDGSLRQLTMTGSPDQIIDQMRWSRLASSRFHGYKWSPDGRKIAYISTNIKQVRTLLIPNYSGRFVVARPQRRGVAGDDGPLDSLVVLDVEGKAKAVTMGEANSVCSIRSLEWSPDSTRLAVNRLSPDHKECEVLVADAGTGNAAVVFREHDERWISPLTATLVWSPDSTRLLLSRERDYNHLLIVSADSGEPVHMTQGSFEINYWRSGREPQWITPLNRIFFHSTEASTAERHLYSVSPSGGKRSRIINWEGMDEGTVSPDGRMIVLLHADTKHPGDLYLLENKEEAQPERITTTPLKEFFSYEWPEPQIVEFKSRADGKTIRAKLLLPPGVSIPSDRKSEYDAQATPPKNRNRKTAPAKTYPVVVFVHGAGYAQSVLKQWGSYNQILFVFNNYLAQQGYVVLDIDYRGSSGYGRDWRTDVYLHLGGLDLEDEISGVEYLKTLGVADTDRVGIWGLSYGGFMTNMAMFNAGDVFKVGVSWAAVNDWENYSPPYTHERLTTPKDNPEAYRRSSPIHFSNGLKGPLLLIHGMADDNVHVQDTVQLVEKLISEGKHVDVMFYPQENHVFVRDDTLIDAFTRTAEFFDRYLKK
ncbi:MAG: S9 family peptidase [Candidatus Tectomicrobia bacterium]|nr:S9 family peptidase [Candidatus Tectomicrobia bacterium]